ncbi:MAG TPA: ABC transporter permease, partial [bacterium]|nr:ABC transporter permease [bacterium]
MLGYIAYRLAIAIPLLLVLSVVSFVIIQLPPGDYLTTYINNLKLSGIQLNEDEVVRLKQLYGLDKPVYMQYFIWIGNFIKGDLGRSFQWNRPVNEILAERVPMTVLISVLTTLFAWIIAIPIGIYSALRQYSVFDYTFTFIGYIG